MVKFLIAMLKGVLVTICTLSVIVLVAYLARFYPEVLGILWVVIMISIPTYMFYED